MEINQEQYIIDNNLNPHDISEEKFIEYYGSTLKDMLMFGTRYPGSELDEFFPRLEVYLESAEKKTTLGFYDELSDSIKNISHTDEIFLASKDSDGDVFLLMQAIPSDFISLILILSNKHKFKFEIGPPVLEINFIQIWFYPSK